MRNRWQLGPGVLATMLMGMFLSSPCAASGKPGAPAAPRPLHRYHSSIPLGSEVFTYEHESTHQIFYVMASAQDREFEGQEIWLDGDRHVLKTSGGKLVENYPRHVRFRVSVCERDSSYLIDAPIPIATHANTFDEFISGLKFEMVVFHALTYRTVQPAKVTHIGIPLDVPSNERIYEVSFDVGDVPITDRIVMHVLTDQGERLAKFNVDLF
jgi:hypothetical protein